MSDIRFNQWLHQSGTGGVTQLSTGHVGIGTTDPLIPVHAGNNAVLNVGVVTANSYHGSAANLTSIPAGQLTGTVADARISTLTASKLTGALPAISGANLTGISAGAGGDTGLDLNDNVKIRLGTGNDLEIYHDGNDSYIGEVGTGSLKVLSNLFRVNNAANSESMIQAHENGQVELYFDNSKKMETKAGGVQVHGNLMLDSDNDKAIFGASNDLQIYHDGNSRVVNTNNAVNLVLQTDYVTVRGNSANKDYIKCLKDAQVELYYNNAKKLATTDTGVQISHTGDAQLQLLADTDNNGGNNWPHVQFRVDNTSGQAEAQVAYRQDNAVLKVDIAGTEKVGVNANGLVFNGGTAAASALDDYEEGSWTPTVASSNASFSTVTGRYTKIGRVVTLWFKISGGGSYSGSGGLQIGGIPFANNTGVQPIGNSEYYKINFASGYTDHVTPYLTGNNVMWLRNNSGNGSGNYLTVNLFNSSASINTTICYTTNS